MQIFSTMLIAAAGVLSAAVNPAAVAQFSLQTRANGEQMSFSNVIMNSAAYNVFLTADLRYPEGTEPPKSKSQSQKGALPTVNKYAAVSNSAAVSDSAAVSSSTSDENPDIIYVLQCTEAGFRGKCTVFGAPAGRCVSYYDFNSKGSKDISDRFNNKITSLSTNTGGVCQFYKYTGCDESGWDRGLATSYNFNLGVPLPQDTRTTQYQNRISSWRC